VPDDPTAAVSVSLASVIGDDGALYFMIGGRKTAAGLYRVTYSPKLAGTTAPKSTTRPGGSFGLGLDLFQSNRIVVGGLLTYHGVVLASSSARSYVIAALNVTLRPSDY